MKKILLAVLAAALVISMSACARQTSGNVNNEASAGSSYSESQDDGASADGENTGEEASTEETDGVYETLPLDETDPATEPEEASQSAESIADISEISGVWSPEKAESVASGSEVTFLEAFGSVYNTYGGALNISQDGTFSLNIGIYSYKGTITTSADGLQVQYDDNSTDTYEYFTDADGNRLIKARVNDYFVYFG